MKTFVVAQRLSTVAYEVVQAETAEAARATVVGRLGGGELFTDCASQATLQDDGQIVVAALSDGQSAHDAASALLRG